MNDKEQAKLCFAKLCFASAHVILEAGILPGINVACRCEECRLVARAMDSAGYMGNVKDKWWIDDEVRDGRRP